MTSQTAIVTAKADCTQLEEQTACDTKTIQHGNAVTSPPCRHVQLALPGTAVFAQVMGL